MTQARAKKVPGHLHTANATFEFWLGTILDDPEKSSPRGNREAWS